TLKARDDRGPAIAVQVLICPVTDSSQSTDSYRRNGEGLYIDRWQMQWFWDSYIPDPADRSSAYASPAHAESLEDLPPAIVVVAGLDPLVDEGLEYAARLEREANGATVWTYPGQIHGFMGLIGVLNDAKPAVERLADALAQRLHR
ncbi:MAG TPA: alpha/beta hydrolase fold domain-containing protein, partial [Longimicrobiales bacterium]|nr:alpha/beta hydrolase fold domain-containing protein [Longimicrobiales bacterium]